MGNENVRKGVYELHDFLSVKDLLPSLHLFQVLFKCIDACGKCTMCLYVFLYVEFGLEEGKYDFFFSFVVFVDEFYDEKGVSDIRGDIGGVWLDERA